MSIGDLFWLFFMFTALQPLLREKQCTSAACQAVLN